VVDLALPDRFGGKGICIGLAAAIKLTPLIFIPYLLLTRRVRAAVVSMLTLGATIALGFALLPTASAAFWRGRFNAFGHFRLLNQSIYGSVLRLTHNAPQGHAYWLAAAIVVGVVGLATAVAASRRGHELLGAVVCGATSLLVSPVSWTHHWVYVVPALALAACGPRRLSLRVAATALVIALFACWPVPTGGAGGFRLSSGWFPHGLLRLVPHYGPGGTGSPELHWNALEEIAGNYYVIAALLFIAAVACALIMSRPRTQAAAVDMPDARAGLSRPEQTAREPVARRGAPLGRAPSD
jgi:alpha-1,2-mannosyltransferase